MPAACLSLICLMPESNAGLHHRAEHAKNAVRAS